MKTIRCDVVNGVGAQLVARSEDELTSEMIDSEVVYYWESGDFYRRVDGPLKSAFANRLVGIMPCQITVIYHRKQQAAVCLFGLRIPADRLAFFCLHGRWPAIGLRMKHIDGDDLNNREYNIREMLPRESLNCRVKGLSSADRKDRTAHIRYLQTLNEIRPGSVDIDAIYGNVDVDEAEVDRSDEKWKQGMVYDRHRRVWIAYDESDSGVRHVECDSEFECSRQRDRIRSEAAFIAEFEAEQRFTKVAVCGDFV